VWCYGQPVRRRYNATEDNIIVIGDEIRRCMSNNSDVNQKPFDSLSHKGAFEGLHNFSFLENRKKIVKISL
jgi:hypothetical protein